MSVQALHSFDIRLHNHRDSRHSHTSSSFVTLLVSSQLRWSSFPVPLGQCAILIFTFLSSFFFPSRIYPSLPSFPNFCHLVTCSRMFNCHLIIILTSFTCSRVCLKASFICQCLPRVPVRSFSKTTAIVGCCFFSLFVEVSQLYSNVLFMFPKGPSML